MFDYLVRFAKRFVVLIPGIVIAILSVHDIFPWFDRHFPAAVAILLTYIIGAYVLIPAFIRLVRLAFPARHLQSYCVTPDGFASDPLNIGIIGSKQDLVTAMQKAGWYEADPHSLPHLARQIACAILNRPYPSAPMSNLYLFGRRQDIGFELPIDGARGARHHVRFWATAYHGSTRELKFGTIEWHRHRRRAGGDGVLWVGAASRDIGFAFIRHNVQVTHMIHPDTDTERDVIIRDLHRVHLVRKVDNIRLRGAYRLINRAWFGHLKSDGRLRIVKLKNL